MLFFDYFIDVYSAFWLLYTSVHFYVPCTNITTASHYKCLSYIPVFFVMWLTEFNQVSLYDIDVELPLEAAEERSGGNPQSWRSSPPISLRLRDIKWYLLLNDHDQWKANNR